MLLKTDGVFRSFVAKYYWALVRLPPLNSTLCKRYEKGHKLSVPSPPLHQVLIIRKKASDKEIILTKTWKHNLRLLDNSSSDAIIRTTGGNDG